MANSREELVQIETNRNVLLEPISSLKTTFEQNVSIDDLYDVDTEAKIGLVTNAINSIIETALKIVAPPILDEILAANFSRFSFNTSFFENFDKQFFEFWISMGFKQIVLDTFTILRRLTKLSESKEIIVKYGRVIKILKKIHKSILKLNQEFVKSKKIKENAENENEFSIEVSKEETILLKKAEMPESVINSETRLILLGEGNFSFTVAFASKRKSWKNIYPSTYESNPLPNVSSVILLTMKNVLNDANNNQEKTLELLKEISNLNETDQSDWAIGIDATKNIPDNVPLDVVWFQCPWATKWKRTNLLLENFLKHLSGKQSSGMIAIIGMITILPYISSYGVQSLINNEFYEFIGADNKLIFELLTRGYRHLGIRDIHHIIYHSHLSLIFKRK